MFGLCAAVSPGETSQDLPSLIAAVPGGTGHQGHSKGAIAGIALAAVVGMNDASLCVGVSPGVSNQDLPSLNAAVPGGTGHQGFSKGSLAGSALAFALVRKLRQTNTVGQCFVRFSRALKYCSVAGS